MMLKIWCQKIKKNPDRIVQETHLDQYFIIHSEIGKTFESAAVDFAIRLDKTSHDSLTNQANEFRLFKEEMQQQISSLR